MGEQGTRGLMTVGELASRVGVTVRTIQYYDQRGLLHPRAKASKTYACTRQPTRNASTESSP